MDAEEQVHEQDEQDKQVDKSPETTTSTMHQQQQQQPPLIHQNQPVLLRKSSSRDYSRVMCESTLSRNKMERQPSMRRVAPPPKKSYFGHHLFGCFPGRRSSTSSSSRSSSLQLIPKLVLAPDGATGVAEIIGRAARCGSKKGGPAFSRVPTSDYSARGSYSEPTSPQVTCIGQVKTRKKQATGSSSSSASRSKGRPQNPQAQPGPQLERTRSGRSRPGGGFELQRTRSGRVLTRSGSNRKEQLVVSCSSQEIISAESQQESCATQVESSVGVQSRASVEECAEKFESDRNSRDSPKEAPDVAQHKQLVREVSQAFQRHVQVEDPVDIPSSSSGGSNSADIPSAADIPSSSSDIPSSSSDIPSSSSEIPSSSSDIPSSSSSSAAASSSSSTLTTTTPLSELLATSAALSRLDSFGGISDPSPRACLWMRRSMGRPIALDLRKHNG